MYIAYFKYFKRPGLIELKFQALAENILCRNFQFSINYFTYTYIVYTHKRTGAACRN